ncbi:MAG TPA: hypothetical protein VE988_00960 [Gemmataceae bacterium]|nr:hypothetical protein [Gemmataceae bacterium]
MRRFAKTSSAKKSPAVFERSLDKLLSLAFVTGSYDNEDYWSLVQHCRQSTPATVYNHARLPGAWYDVVLGPVAAFWQQRVAMQDADQFSFHTKAGIDILDALIQQGLKSGPNGDPDYYTWFPVP